METPINTDITVWTNSESLVTIKEMYAKNATQSEFQVFGEIGKRCGMNPFLKEIWLVKYGDNPAQIFIGRDGYRKSAQRHPLYDFHVSDAVYSADKFDVVNGEVNHKYNLANRGALVGAYCVVQRKGSSRPTYVFVELKEYSTSKSLWHPQTGKPATMIKKVAEAQGLKSAFQELFAGTYSEYEEFGQSGEAVSNTRPGKGVSGLKEKLGMAKAAGAAGTDDLVLDAEPVEFDGETGEVIEAEVTSGNVQSETNVETVRFLMESADSVKELMEAVDMATSLPEAEKKEMRTLFKKRQGELK